MEPLSYKDAGVNISEQDRFVEAIRKINPDIGSFSGLFPLPMEGYSRPQLVAGTDGVGTKVLLAEMMDKYDTVGIDCVAMVANDLICCGARPLFFLDYYALSRLDAGRATQVLKGVLEGCRQSQCKLIGGETAEMPGVYSEGHFDLVGFMVGIVDQDNVIDGSRIEPGDAIIGLASSGVHSNGLSLARKVFFDKLSLKPRDGCEGLSSSVGDTLITPTRIYVDVIMKICEVADIKGIAHITGGGLADNVPRILPENSQAVLDSGAWTVPEVFQAIEKHGPVERDEMLHTFNMGLGMVVVLPAAEAEDTLKVCRELGVEAWLVGSIEKGERRTMIR